MIGDAYVYVTCDSDDCRENEEISLTPLGRGRSWDDRNVKHELERLGWLIEGDKTFCPECDEALNEDADEEDETNDQ